MKAREYVRMTKKYTLTNNKQNIPFGVEGGDIREAGTITNLISTAASTTGRGRADKLPAGPCEGSCQLDGVLNLVHREHLRHTSARLAHGAGDSRAAEGGRRSDILIYLSIYSFKRQSI